MNYFDSQEHKDFFDLLTTFNEQVKWFVKLEPQPQYSSIDAIGTDYKGRKIWIELKERDGKLLSYQKFGNVFIEPSKFAAFTKEFGDNGAFERGEGRLYINFIEDGVIIFNLNELKFPIQPYMNHKHSNIGKEKFEFEDRLGLDIRDAIVYTKKDGQYQRVYPQYPSF